MAACGRYAHLVKLTMQVDMRAPAFGELVALS